MNWIPIYITGRVGFERDVLRALEHTNFTYMPGYLQDNTLAGAHAMIWISEETPLRQLKYAIGHKVIFRYRLHFFTDLEAFIEEHEQEIQLPEPEETEAFTDLKKSA